MENSNSKADDKKTGRESTTGIVSKLGPVPDDAFENDACADPAPGDRYGDDFRKEVDAMVEKLKKP